MGRVRCVYVPTITDYRFLLLKRVFWPVVRQTKQPLWPLEELRWLDLICAPWFQTGAVIYEWVRRRDAEVAGPPKDASRSRHR